MDIDTPEASASCSSNSSVATHQPYRPAPASLDEVFYANYPVVQDTPVGQPIEDWRYEMRREPQLILPNLYLGPFQTSKQLDKMKSLGITHIVCIRDQKEAFLVKPRFPQDFVYLTLDISDHEDQNLIRVFPKTRAFIDEAIAAGGTVFVHCNGGISLGPSVVVGYVMWRLESSYEDALKHVQARRYCISPNQGFMYQLKEYEPIYKALRATQLQPAGSPVWNNIRRKRTGDEGSDDEDGEGLGGDIGGNGVGEEGGAVEVPAEWSHRPERRMARMGERR